MRRSVKSMLEQKVLLQVLDSQQEASMDTFQSYMQCIQFQKAETWVNNYIAVGSCTTLHFSHCFWLLPLCTGVAMYPNEECLA